MYICIYRCKDLYQYISTVLIECAADGECVVDWRGAPMSMLYLSLHMYMYIYTYIDLYIYIDLYVPFWSSAKSTGKAS